MATRTLNTDVAGPLALEVRAEALNLTVAVDATVTTPTLELEGPAELVDEVQARTEGSRWIIDVPAPEPTVITGGANIQIGGSNAGVIAIGGSNAGVIAIGGTTTVVNGTVITGPDTVRVTGSGGATTVITGTGGVEQVAARVWLPEGSCLRSRLTSGRVHTTGGLEAIDHQGHNTSVEIEAVADAAVDTHNGEVHIGSLSGETHVETHNGPVSIDATGERTSVATHNGMVDITAGSDGPISARTHNGNVTVHTGRFDPRVRTRTHNGRERVL